jgi:hypothetical protein
MTNELVSQYKAAVKMLENDIELCPNALWNDGSYKNIFWQIVYHTLHYTNLYLAESEESFIPWSKHIQNWHRFEHLNNEEMRGADALQYSKEELLSFAAQTAERIEIQVTEEDLYRLSGFEWLKITKLELHFYNLRHLQHHTGQLTERLQQHNIKGLSWVDVGGNVSV